VLKKGLATNIGERNVFHQPNSAKQKENPLMFDSKRQKFIFKSELLERLGQSYPTLWKRMRRGEFPLPRILGNKNVWLASEVDDYLAGLPCRQYTGPATSITTPAFPLDKRKKLKRRRRA
jgi:predicted DNA-binding transcriptional regulator AlpA